MLDRRRVLAGLAGAGASLALPDIGSAAPTLESMVGQLLLLGFVGADAQAPAAQRVARQVAAGEVGGVMLLGHNARSREGVESLAALFRASARGVPPFIAIDQ